MCEYIAMHLTLFEHHRLQRRIHNCLMERLANGNNPPMLCDAWYAYIMAFTQSLATSLEFILATRGKSKDLLFIAGC